MGVGEDVVVGRAFELAQYERDLEALRAGQGGATAFTGDPGIGKTRLLAALAGAASAAGVATLTVRTSAWAGQSPGQDLVDALAEARRTPKVAMYVDDVHRLPMDCAPLLGELIQLARTRPVLLALACRPRQVDPAIGTVLCWAEASVALRHAVLRPFGLAETRALLAEYDEADHDDVERIHSRSGGNPLYSKLLGGRAVESAGGLVGELAGLGSSELQTAQAASVLGGQFTMDLLTEVSATDSAATSQAVESLIVADILRLGEPVPLLAFRHPVVADVTYQNIPITERWRLHRRADEALTRRGAAATDRAPHIAAAGFVRPTGVDVLLAAAAASLNADPARALGWAGAARAFLTDGDDPRWADAEALMARSRLLMGDITQARQNLVAPSGAGDRRANAVDAGRALALLGRNAEAGALLREGLATVGDDPSPEAASLLSDLANLASERMDFEAATRFAATAADLARGHGDRLREAAAMAEQAWASGCAGDFQSARAAATAAAALVDAMSDGVLICDLRCLYQLGLAELLVDDPINTYRHVARGVELCRRPGQGYMMAPLLETLGEVQLRLGRMSEAVETMNEAVYQANRDDLVPHQSVAAGIRGIARYWLGGDIAEVVADAEAIEARCAGLPWSWAVLSRCMAGELMMLAGDPTRGIRLLLDLGGGPELPSLPSRRQVRTWDSLIVAALEVGDDSSAHRYAELAARHPTVVDWTSRRGVAARAWIRARGRWSEPGELSAATQSAAADFASIHHWHDLVATELAAGTAFLDAGRLDLAGEYLHRAADHAAACGSGRLSGLVAAARERLQPPPNPAWVGRLTTDSRLTSREVNVAELAITGLTSAQIGQQLFLSTRTVDSHLGRIYRKLGVSSRTALTTLVAGIGHR
jgi:DNA-binding CsgD family transcriptional regulator